MESSAAQASTQAGALVCPLIGMGFLVCLIIFCIYMAVHAPKQKKRNQQKLQQELQQRLAAYNALFYGAFTHFNGLSIAEGVVAYIYWCRDKITIVVNNMKFNLPLSRIIDITVKTNVEIQKQYVSSAGGAVGGAALFGPIGAMIGGRVKEKQDTIITKYMIITYTSNDEVKYMAFQTYDDAGERFVDAFNKIKPQQTKNIDL